MSEERNVAIEVSLDGLINQTTVLERRLDSALGRDQVDQSEKAPIEHRPIGILIEQLPGDIEVLTSKITTLITTFDETFINTDNSVKSGDTKFIHSEVTKV